MSDTHIYVRAEDKHLMAEIAHRDDGWNDEEFRKHELARAYGVGMERAKIEHGTVQHGPAMTAREFLETTCPKS